MTPAAALAPLPAAPPAAALEHGLVRAADGEPLYYHVYGRGTPLLLHQGLVSGGCHWPFFIDHFRRDYRVVSWEYRGHAGAPTPRDPRTIDIEHFAADGHAVAAQLAPGGAIVAGLSFGVQVALEHYRAYPDDVRALVLICGTYGHPLDRISPAPALRRGAAALARGFGGLGPLGRLALRVFKTELPHTITYLVGGAHRELCPRRILDALFDHVARIDPRVFGEAFHSYFEHSAEDMLSTIRVPTLIIAGDQDQLTPASVAERMQAQIPGARLVVFPGHTHLVQVERPQAVHAVVESFLADVGLAPVLTA
ncbi:MAG TPA: alpha/beta hydrolase [Polyangia bacterium]|jgi:pimeloyl-ACP methyl ester carboxylesterase